MHLFFVCKNKYVGDVELIYVGRWLFICNEKSYINFFRRIHIYKLQ